jgi:hypothetical protein
MSCPLQDSQSQKHLHEFDVSDCQDAPIVGTISPAFRHLPLQTLNPKLSELETGFSTT